MNQTEWELRREQKSLRTGKVRRRVTAIPLRFGQANDRPLVPLNAGNVPGYPIKLTEQAHSRTFAGAFRSAPTNAPLSVEKMTGYSD